MLALALLIGQQRLEPAAVDGGVYAAAVLAGLGAIAAGLRAGAGAEEGLLALLRWRGLLVALGPAVAARRSAAVLAAAIGLALALELAAGGALGARRPI